jgi:hypothetical protein
VKVVPALNNRRWSDHGLRGKVPAAGGGAAQDTAGSHIRLPGTTSGMRRVARPFVGAAAAARQPSTSTGMRGGSNAR